MAGYEQKDDTGVIFKELNKKSDRHPDYKGSATIDGEEYWVSGWIKTAGASARNPGSKFLSLAFQKKDGGFEQPARTSAPKANSTFPGDFDDDIPF